MLTYVDNLFVHPLDYAKVFFMYLNGAYLIDHLKT